MTQQSQLDPRIEGLDLFSEQIRAHMLSGPGAQRRDSSLNDEEIRALHRRGTLGKTPILPPVSCHEAEFIALGAKVDAGEIAEADLPALRAAIVGRGCADGFESAP